MGAFADMRAAVGQARTTLEAADSAANDMAYLIRGRLRHVNTGHLDALKAELADYNRRTGTWK